MSEIISSIMTPAVKTTITVVVVFLVLLYLISIIWTIRDAKMRGASIILWGVVSLIPYVGALAYSLLRPPLYEADREEQEWDMRMKQRELAKTTDCYQCGYPADPEFLICPRCGTQLKNQCPRCGHALNPDWIACPYCCTHLNGAPQAQMHVSAVHHQELEAGQAEGEDGFEAGGHGSHQAARTHASRSHATSRER